MKDRIVGAFYGVFVGAGLMAGLLVDDWRGPKGMIAIVLMGSLLVGVLLSGIIRLLRSRS